MTCASAFSISRRGEGEYKIRPYKPRPVGVNVLLQQAKLDVIALSTKPIFHLENTKNTVPHSILESTKSTILDGVPQTPTSENTVRYA